MSDAALRAYYNERAPVYDHAYSGTAPAWVDAMAADLRAALADRHVLEIACGTGHWTRYAAEVATSVTAIDTAPAMLAIARAKLADLARVTVVAADAYRLDELGGRYTGGLGMQWLSHVPAARDGDTYEARELPDGSTHEILENYFTADDLRAMVAPYGTDVRLTMGDWWWWLTYQVR